jgi:hypothetical protein
MVCHRLQNSDAKQRNCFESCIQNSSTALQLYSGPEENSLLLWNKKFQYRVQNNPTINLYLLTTVHAPISHAFKIQFQSLTHFFAPHLIQCVSYVSDIAFIPIYLTNLSVELYTKKPTEVHMIWKK